MIAPQVAALQQALDAGPVAEVREGPRLMWAKEHAQVSVPSGTKLYAIDPVAIAAVLAELKRLQKVEARYKHLADNFLGADFNYGVNDREMHKGRAVLLIDHPSERDIFSDLDSTIDYALKVTT